MNSLQALQNRFSHVPQIVFEQRDNGLILAKIDTPRATATISLFGGQILEWKPKEQAAPVLWQSDLVQLTSDKPIRAGVPICWPWFGAHLSRADLPSHGYARISNWNLDAVSFNEMGAIELCLTMSGAAQFDVQQDFFAILAIKISIGEVLSIDLTTTNTGTQDIQITEALHTYLNVSDITQVQIQGLDSSHYIDLIDHNVLKLQSGPVHFSSELGRVYLDTKSTCLIEDSGLSRTIRIEKSGSQSTIVWNPWRHTASKMSDLGPTQWQTMVCVESGNALQNTISIKPGAQHCLSVSYSVFNHDA